MHTRHTTFCATSVAAVGTAPTISVKGPDCPAHQFNRDRLRSNAYVIDWLVFNVVGCDLVCKQTIIYKVAAFWIVERLAPELRAFAPATFDHHLSNLSRIQHHRRPGQAVKKVQPRDINTVLTTSLHPCSCSTCAEESHFHLSVCHQTRTTNTQVARHDTIQ